MEAKRRRRGRRGGPPHPPPPKSIARCAETALVRWSRPGIAKGTTRDSEQDYEVRQALIHDAMLAHPSRWSEQTLRAAANIQSVINASNIVAFLDQIEAVYRRGK